MLGSEAPRLGEQPNPKSISSVRDIVLDRHPKGLKEVLQVAQGPGFGQVPAPLYGLPGCRR